MSYITLQTNIASVAIINHYILCGIAGVVLSVLGSSRYEKLCPAVFAYIGTIFLSAAAGFIMFFYPDYINQKVYERNDHIGTGCKSLIKRINHSIKLLPYYTNDERRKQVEQGLAILRPPKSKDRSDPRIWLEPDLWTQYRAQNEIYRLNYFMNCEKTNLTK